MTRRVASSLKTTKDFLESTITSGCLNENKWFLHSRVWNTYNVLNEATKPPQRPKLRKEGSEESTAVLSVTLMLCVDAHMLHTVHVPRSEDSLQESVLSHHMSPRNTPQVATLSSKGLCITSHLTSAYGVVFSSSPPGEIRSSTEHLAMSEDIFGCHNWGSATSKQLIEAKDAAKHLYRMAPVSTLPRLKKKLF